MKGPEKESYWALGKASDELSKGWRSVVEVPPPTSKKLISLRIDADVIDWFKEQGPGYQTRINAVLRAFIEHKEGK